MDNHRGAERDRTRHTRRAFLRAAAALAAGGETLLNARASSAAPEAAPPFFQTRGLVLTPGELEAMDCPALAKRLGINLLDFGHLVVWAAKEELGQKTMAECRRLGIDVEFGYHGPSGLLPRDLFDQDPSMFRMDEQGNRVREHNLCVHSERALEIACEAAARLSAVARPTTGRYHIWIDDGMPMCRCPKCRGLSDSDQALIFEHHLLKRLRRDDPKATVAHLAYQYTMAPPTQIKPEPGIFLEFAPIERDSRKPLADPVHAKLLEQLDANLALFGKEETQVLEYWLDNSRFSGWKRENIRQVPWDRELFLSDLRVYAERGIRHVRTYAFWFDADYIRRYGPPPFDEYAEGLRRWRLVGGKADGGA